MHIDPVWVIQHEYRPWYPLQIHYIITRRVHDIIVYVWLVTGMTLLWGYITYIYGWSLE